MYRILDKRNRPLEFINPQGKDKLRNIYRFNSKNPLEFTCAAAAQAYLNKQFGEIAHLAGLAYDDPQELPLRLWRKIKAIHYYLRIVSSETPGIALPEALPWPKVFIVVRGGNVEAVYAAPGTEYVLIDHDNGAVDEVAAGMNRCMQLVLDGEINKGVVKQIDEAGWEHCKVPTCPTCGAQTTRPESHCPPPMPEELWISSRAVTHKIARLNTQTFTVEIEGAPEKNRTFATWQDAKEWLTRSGYNFSAAYVTEKRIPS